MLAYLETADYSIREELVLKVAVLQRSLERLADLLSASAAPRPPPR